MVGETQPQKEAFQLEHSLEPLRRPEGPSPRKAGQVGAGSPGLKAQQLPAACPFLLGSP